MKKEKLCAWGGDETKSKKAGPDGVICFKGRRTSKKQKQWTKNKKKYETYRPMTYQKEGEKNTGEKKHRSPNKLD